MDVSTHETKGTVTITMSKEEAAEMLDACQYAQGYLDDFLAQFEALDSALAEALDP